ncbi:MAG: CT583 family protein [Chlamydiia bacterium]|nr:CT583 family protein [Chlamydiia bacterium]
MSKLNSLLMGRFLKPPKKEKMNELIERSSENVPAKFGGVFQVTPLNEKEKDSLQALLEKYQTEDTDVAADLQSLSSITSEVKAISNQAVILHGERIKKAQTLFKKYRDGAFSNWLLKTYGNRQTPYNFMQYYELYNSLPKKLQGIVDEMPRQAIYSLSSRSIPHEKKEAFVEGYQGESKTELLEKLRTAYPLAKKDKRNPNKTKGVLESLRRALKGMQNERFLPSDEEKAEVEQLLAALTEHFSQ